MAAYLLLEAINRLPRPRRFKVPRNHLELDDFEFRKLFRLPRNVFNDVCDAVRGDLEGSNLQKVTAMTPEHQVLTALRFYGTGSYQQVTATDGYLSCSQGQVSKVISSVTKAIIRCLGYKISFPQTADEKNRNKVDFYNYKENHFPGIIGAIDGTQVEILAPPANSLRFNQGAYFCRKGFYSLNPMIVCDARMRIINIEPNYPGSSHDSFVWRMSPLRRAFEEGRLNGSEWLIGDSGYPLEPWLLPSIANATNQTEEAYNKKHKSTRSIVERCIGILKMRFRCLTRQRHLMYSPDRASAIITACAILHNMCRDADDGEDLPIPDDEAGRNLQEAETPCRSGRQQQPHAAVNIPVIDNLPVLPNATAFQQGRRNQLRVLRVINGTLQE